MPPQIKGTSLTRKRQPDGTSTWRAGVSVPSTSNKTSLLMGLSAKVLGAIPDEGMVVEARKHKTNEHVSD